MDKLYFLNILLFHLNMKRIILILLVVVSGKLLAQNYNITGIMAGGAIVKTKKESKAILQDSLFNVTYEGSNVKYKVTKKVSETYFMTTDGIKDFIFKITFMDKVTRGPGFKYDTVLNVESGQVTYVYYALKQP